MGSSGGEVQQHYHQRETTNPGGDENFTVAATVQQGTPGTYWFRDSPRDWPTETAELRWMWELHVYSTASLFTVLALLCLFTILRLRAQLSQSRNVTSLNVFLGILATARLLVLYLDPYGSKLILPSVMLQVLWDLGFPCLASAFSLLQLAVMKETGMTGVAVASEPASSIIITFHFCLAITAAVMAAVQKWLRVMWLITQLVFIAWGGFLFLSTLLGCLRVLRSAKAPLKFLTQVDPGCDVNNIIPLNMFTEHAQERPQRQHEKHQRHPRIHITDVDDQTYSYASDGSLPVLNTEMQRSESLPLHCLQNVASSRIHSPNRKIGRKPSSSDEDPASAKPLMDRPRRYTISEKVGSHVRGPATIFNFDPRHHKQSQKPSMFDNQAQKETSCRIKPKGRFEQSLRHLVFTAGLGIALCLLRSYDVLRLDGLLSMGSGAEPLIQWFFFQTLSRLVELVMAYAMVCGSQQPLSNRYYYYRN